MEIESVSVLALNTFFSVTKRDGITNESFDSTKPVVAIQKAAKDANEIIPPDSLQSILGLITNHFKGQHTVGVEEIQNKIEQILMQLGYLQTAKHYILYRDNRRKARERRRTSDPEALASYIHPGKYARHIKSINRREVYPETVRRLEDMHLRRFAAQPEVCEQVRWAFQRVYDKRVLPSMRSMQFGGLAIERNNARLYNCCFSFVDRMKAFAEGIWLLLSGSGIGFSVQYEHVERLPTLKYIDRSKVRHHVISDTIEGWADAIDRLTDSYVKGYYVEFAYNKIRDKGAELHVSGGVAPGHMGLKESIENVRKILDLAQGRQLKPIECYDIMCHLAAAVLSGGIRRSAMICLFSLEDGEMMNAKPEKYWEDRLGRQATPWRGYSNNSVMLKRDEVNKKTFRRIFKMTRQAGEPGFYFCTDFNHGTNPCVEIGLDCVLKINDETIGLMETWAEEAKNNHFLLQNDNPVELHSERLRLVEWAKKHRSNEVVGWAFCNLTTQNASRFKTPEDFYESARAASIIGTVQATYTRFPYLAWASEIIARRDALLGVSMTGIMAAPHIALNPQIQQQAAKIVNETNTQMTKMVGIRVAARTTCVKPEGTGSKELGIGEEGIHLAHARRYLQCILANEDEAPFKHFQKVNPHMCIKVPGSNLWAIYFPMESPAGAKVREDMSALEFLNNVLSTQKNWVIPGNQRPEQTPGISHNVSNTVTVRDDEWDGVADFIYDNRQFFTGLSFLAFKADKEYGPFAPKQSVVTEADEARWNELVTLYKPVDYSTMIEEKDATAVILEPACAGGSCT